MKVNVEEPTSVDEVMALLQEGVISVSEALEQLRRLERSAVPGRTVTTQESSQLDQALQQLDSLVGLQKVKALVHEIRAFLEIQKRRAREGLATEPNVLHMIFKGNPGTGKTTVARILGSIFKEMGLLPKGHLVEVERADLVGEYIGHTAQKTREQIRRALGGILFIDEAYSLARGGERDFGKEAIDALVKGMEDHSTNVVLILAGYRDEMEFFLRSNPGLRSRFPIQVDFPDYTVEELMAIAELMLARRDYTFTGEARETLLQHLQERCALGRGRAGNARLVRNIVERAIRRQAVRLMSARAAGRADLMCIKACDMLEALAEL